jgi:hypothetical protein
MKIWPLIFAVSRLATENVQSSSKSKNLNEETEDGEIELLSQVAHHPKGLVFRGNGRFRKTNQPLGTHRRASFSSGIVRLYRANGFNSESDPPLDLGLSEGPEERADNRICILP